jgi:hypothetical protein
MGILWIFLAILLLYLILEVTILFMRLVPILIVAWIFYKIWQKIVQKT